MVYNTLEELKEILDVEYMAALCLRLRMLLEDGVGLRF